MGKLTVFDIGGNKVRLKGKLKGLWRYRVGSYKVVYRANEVNKVVAILLIASRGEVYQK